MADQAPPTQDNAQPSDQSGGYSGDSGIGESMQIPTPKSSRPTPQQILNTGKPSFVVPIVFIAIVRYPE